ncbi:hypothetical protein [Pararhodonellum marinum]|uniref:hypothetical protein n=1 Tax=Pararhodonellum marinum TaxID=2755358 RepID=UPI00188F03D6|nr:hypothetical protein [Pararhodonellum marinum]
MSLELNFIDRLKFHLVHNRKTQLTVGTALFLLNVIWLGPFLNAGKVSPLYYLLFPFVLSLFQFTSTPLLRGLGIYRYYSHFLLGYLPGKSKQELHTGTSFDYFLHLKWSDRGVKSRDYIFGELIQGLLNLIKEVEEGRLPLELNIVATSYFFSNRSLEKLGFRQTSATLFNRLNVLLNFLDIFWMYSFSRNKLVFPNLLKVKKIEILAGELLEEKETLKQIKRRFEQKRNRLDLPLTDNSDEVHGKI